MQDPELRRRSHVGLNKRRAAKLAPSRSLLQPLLCYEIRDRSYENQRYRASGLNLAGGRHHLYGTPCNLQRAVDHLRKQEIEPGPDDLAHLSPLGWEHINLTGDYAWEAEELLNPDQFSRCGPAQVSAADGGFCDIMARPPMRGGNRNILG